MNQKDLESFVKVVEAGSFSQAALLMRKPQPALSRHVRELESVLRVTLLYRNGRGVVATEAGRRLYERANAILEQISAARAEALGQAGRGPEHVTIGLPPTVARLLSLKWRGPYMRPIPTCG
jgi:LysR family nitrogen assimilation transcriptional regulator